MKPGNRKAARLFAILAIISMLQVNAGAALAASLFPQSITGKLITRGNQAITVNGNPATSGATVLSDSSIVTGDQVSATINLGPLGSVEIAPNTKINIKFSDGQIIVTLIEGCLVVRAKQGTYGEINASQGKITSNDPTSKEAATLDVCYPPGAPSPIVNQGAAANAGAGASGGTTGGAGGGGINKALVFTVIVGGAGAVIAAVALGDRGEDPSGSS